MNSPVSIDEPYRRSAFSPLPRRAARRPPIASPRELFALAGFALLYHVAFGLTGFGGYGGSVFFATAGLLLLVARRKVRSRRLTAAAGVVLGLLACRLSYAPSFGAWCLATVALFGLALALWQRRVHVTDALLAGVSAVGYSWVQLSAFTRPLVRRLRAERALPVLAAGAIAAIVGLVFVGVFASANPVVAQVAEAAVRELAKFWSPTLFGRAFVTLLAAMIGVGCMRPLITKRSVEGIDAEVPVGNVFRMAATATLVVVNVLFFAYNMLDAIVLLGGRPPAGTTTQAYAHQGVAWLTVALSLTTATLSLFFRDQLTIDARAKGTRRMAFVWVGQSLLLALFAAERVRIHVKYSGLSDLRFVAVFGIVAATTGLLLVAYKIHARRTFMWLVRRQLDGLLIAASLYTVLPTNLLAARVNVARIQRGDLNPLVHLEEQARATESAPVLLALLDHPDARVRAGVAFAERDTMRRLGNVAITRWSERNFADGRAREALSAASARIEAICAEAGGPGEFTALKNERAWEAANARY